MPTGHTLSEAQRAQFAVIRSVAVEPGDHGSGGRGFESLPARSTRTARSAPRAGRSRVLRGSLKRLRRPDERVGHGSRVRCPVTLRAHPRALPSAYPGDRAERDAGRRTPAPCRLPTVEDAELPDGLARSTEHEEHRRGRPPRQPAHRPSPSRVGSPPRRHAVLRQCVLVGCRTGGRPRTCRAPVRPDRGAPREGVCGALPRPRSSRVEVTGP
jgi:hypothetical protein